VPAPPVPPPPGRPPPRPPGPAAPAVAARLLLRLAASRRERTRIHNGAFGVIEPPEEQRHVRDVAQSLRPVIQVGLEVLLRHPVPRHCLQPHTSWRISRRNSRERRRWSRSAARTGSGGSPRPGAGGLGGRGRLGGVGGAV